MKAKISSIIKVIIGIVITIMIIVSARFIYGTINILSNITHSQTSKEIERMKNNNDLGLLENLKQAYQHPDSIIQTTKGVITINRSVSYKEFSYITPGYSITILTIHAIHTFFILLVLFIIYRIFKTALTGKIFVLTNVKRIQKISWLLVGYIVFIAMDGFFGNTFFAYFFNSSFNNPDIEVDIERIFPLLFLVLVVFGLSELFRAGVNMKEENDLTI